ncbi:RNA polymerase sigma factor [Arcticibacterium luteifluviistationis]|uniref:RNA polymerase sigma-70 factor n=1 Tax=Arcticibacterium luteifluviistationis TaxID=1784714 RepID=A0A2Z4GBS7_9BACT|nr:sigma-70 family RNA polymerase sigma factor [Arcticibacterium luteifluviistationis]AWV98505.1 RNA polymerase sigma-70 factor [Arcticibacterium luteifluviistationis]
METLNGTIQKVAKGDSKAFTKIYDYYREPGLRFITSIVKDNEEAENMLQEVFIKIWHRRDQINPELNFNAYLYTCLKNMAFDHLKKIDKNQQMLAQYLIKVKENHETAVDVEEIKIDMLLSAMSTLPKKRKRILQLILEEGKSYQEIAEIMRISKNTVKNQLVKAKQYLRLNMDISSAY